MFALIFLTVLFAAVGVFIFLVFMLMLMIGLNGMSGAAAQPWLIGAALTVFTGFNLVSGLLLSVISRNLSGPRWGVLAGTGWSALAFVVQLGIAAAVWRGMR
jgi:hypothetical protein